MELVEP